VVAPAATKRTASVVRARIMSPREWRELPSAGW
jgi:hypothetical protein